MSTQTPELPAAWKSFAKSEALAPVAPPPMPADQVDLIRRTVANGATNDELALFLYDCQRRGIHPLDKLLHFTKRGGKYTPVTSIDFMRSQAAMSGEMAGNDDPFFIEGTNHPESATVTVYRITQGQRFAYAATARWSEYCPDSAPMWKRMPHTMLGKCAEALALRKAFPQQLAGLYAREEMDQADATGYSVSAPRAGVAELGDARASTGGPLSSSVVDADSAGSSPAPRINDYHTTQHIEPTATLPEGAVRIERVDTSPTKNKNVTKAFVVFSTGEQATTINTQLIGLCQQLCQDGTPVTFETKPTKWGMDLVAVHRVRQEEPPDAGNFGSAGELSDSDIPF